MNNLEGAKKISEDNMKQTEKNLTASFLKQIKDLQTMIESRVMTCKTDIFNQVEIITNKVKVMMSKQEVDTII